MELLQLIQNITFIVFACLYAYICIRLLFKKDIRFHEIIKKYHIIIMIFTFVVITNFNPWYVMWVFGTIFWIRGKSIKNVLYISYASELGNILGFALYSEEEVLGIPYFIIMVVITVILNWLGRNKKVNLDRGKTY